jgi:hypothetical protein
MPKLRLSDCFNDTRTIFTEEGFRLVGNMLTRHRNNPTDQTGRDAIALRQAFRSQAATSFGPKEAEYFIRQFGPDYSNFGELVAMLGFVVSWAASSAGTFRQFLETMLRALDFMNRPVVDGDLAYVESIAEILGAAHSIQHVPGVIELYRESRNDPDLFRMLRDVFRVFGRVFEEGEGLKVTEELERELRYFLYWYQRENKGEELMTYVARMTESADDIVALVTLLWEDIASQPRYDILPQGADWYEVGGFLARFTGSRYRYFVREGFDFPKVGLGYQLETQVGSRWFKFRTLSPDDLDWQLERDAEIERANGVRGITILNFAVDTVALHRIVCPKWQPANVRKETGVATRHRTGSVHEQVRAHFRRLLPGWTPSEAKQQEAIARLGRLPEGFTFVSEYERTRPLIAPGSSTSPTSTTPTPAFKVSLEDVFQLVT